MPKWEKSRGTGAGNKWKRTPLEGIRFLINGLARKTRAKDEKFFHISHLKQTDLKVLRKFLNWADQSSDETSEAFGLQSFRLVCIKAMQTRQRRVRVVLQC